jgi:hypothetical protein
VTQLTLLRRNVSVVSFDTFGWTVCGAALALAAAAEVSFNLAG